MKPAFPEFVVQYDPQKHTVKWISSLSRKKGLSYFINIHCNGKEGEYEGLAFSLPIPNSRKPLILKEVFRGITYARTGVAAKMFISIGLNGRCRSDEIEIIIPEILPSLQQQYSTFPTPMEAFKKRLSRLKVFRFLRIIFKKLRGPKLRLNSQSLRPQTNQNRPIVLFGSIATTDRPTPPNGEVRPKVAAGSEMVTKAVFVKAPARKPEGSKKRVSPVAKRSSTSSKRNSTTLKRKKPTTE